MARRANHHQQQKPDAVEPQELVAMFREAGREMPVPTTDMIEDCGFLRTVGWVKGMINRKEEAWEIAAEELLVALETARVRLPKVMPIFRTLAGVHPFDARRALALTATNDTLQASIAALEPFRRKSTQASQWHTPAELIAMDAMTAWRQAGWKDEFPCFPTSPIVRFTKAFLARAGEHHAEGAVAAAFQRGKIAAIARRVTKSASAM